MKKILLFLVFFSFTFLLFACDQLADRAPREPGEQKTPEQIAAETIVDEWEGDLSFLSLFMEDMHLEDAFTATISYEFAEPYLGGTYTNMTTQTYSYFVGSHSTLIHIDVIMIENGYEQNLQMIIEDLGDVHNVYINIAEILDEFDQEFSDMFDITEGWLKINYADTLANLVEIELLKQFIKEMIVWSIPEVSELDAIETELMNMIGADKAEVNLRLEELFDTLFTFDFNDIMAHLFDIDLYAFIYPALNFAATEIPITFQEGTELSLQEIFMDFMVTYQYELEETPYFGFSYGYYESLLTYATVWDFISALEGYQVEQADFVEVMINELNLSFYTPDDYSLQEVFIQLFEEYELYLRNAGFDYDDNYTNVLYDLTWMFWGLSPSDEVLILELFATYMGFEYADPVIMTMEEMMTALLEMLESDLITEGFDYVTYHNLLVTEGLLAMADEITPAQADILFDVMASFMGEEAPVELFALVLEVYQSDYMIYEAIMTLLTALEAEIPEAFLDIAPLISWLETLDIDQLETEAVTFDYNALVSALFSGNFTAYHEGLPDTQIKDLVEVIYEMIQVQFPPAKLILEYQQLIETIHIFNPYLDLNHYGNHEDVQLSVSVQDEHYVETIMTMDHHMIGAFMTDLMGDMATWLQMPELAEPIQLPEFISPIDVFMTINPSNPDTLWIDMDLTDFLNDTGSNYDYFDLSIHIEDHASVNIPASFTDFNQVMHEFGQLYMMYMVMGMLSYVADNAHEMEPGVPYTMEDFNIFDMMPPTFDRALTTFTVDNDGNVHADFYYLDGKAVFTETLDYEAFADMLLQIETREDLLAVKMLVNQNHFTVTRLLALLIASGVSW